MKKIIFLAFALFFVNLGFSQDYLKEEIETVQDLFGAEKRIIIENNIDLTGVDSDKFWKIYDEYEAQRKEISKQKIALLHRYSSVSNASEEQAAEILKQAAILRAADDNLIIKFTEKLKRATSPIVATQFYLIEHYLSDGIRFGILDKINFIQQK